MEALLPIIIGYSVRVVGVLVALWVATRIASWLQGEIIRRLESRGFDATLAGFGASFVRYTFLILTVLACLSVFGIETTSFAAIIGAAGLAVGLAFQGTLSNVASGVMLVAFRPFAKGDLVEVNGVTAVVDEIGLMTTSLDTPENIRIIMPNSLITATTIKVITHNEAVRIPIAVGTDYTADLDKVRTVLQAAANALTHRSPDRAPEIFISSLGASSIDWEVRVWADPRKYWDAWEEATRATKIALDAAGIGIPYPQMDVHVDGKLG